MAVVFISPKRRQKIFFVSVTGIFILLFFTIVAIAIFLKPTQQTAVQFNKPKVTINIKVLDTEKFKNLETFTTIQPQFFYTAKDKSKKVATGYVAAESKELAEKILLGKGLSDISLEDVLSGRDNPYIPY